MRKNKFKKRLLTLALAVVTVFVSGLTAMPVSAVDESGSSDKVVKSSDLNEFLTNVNIYDDKNVLQVGTDSSGETVNNQLYTSTTYTYELQFAERNNTGDYLEMLPNSEGYLIYTIPDSLNVPDDSTEHDVTLSNGKSIGKFIIENHTVKLKILNVDLDGNPSDTSWLDTDGLKKLTLRFTGSFKSLSQQKSDVSFGSDCNVTVNVIDNAELTVKKTAGDYVPATHTMPYTVTVKGSGSDVKDLVLTDTITSANGEILTDSVTAKLGDTDITSLTCAKNTDGSYSISGFPTIPKNQTVTVTYSVLVNVNPEDMKGNSSLTYKVSNEVTGTAKTTWGTTISNSAKTSKDISITEIMKNGSKDTMNDTPVIKWTISLGDGYYSLDGKTLKDTLGQDYRQDFYKTTAIEIRGTKKDGTSTTTRYEWDNSNVKLGTDEQSFELTLPTSDTSSPYTNFYIIYYTTYVGDGTYLVYDNQATTTIDGYPIGAKGRVGIFTGEAPKMSKVGVREGDDLVWTTTIELPAGLQGIPSFYLVDQYQAYIIREDGVANWCYAEVANEDWTITATTKSGQTIDFKEYKSGDPENTYMLVWGMGSSWTVGNPWYNNQRGIFFNCSSATYSQSHWNIDEPATLTVTMRIPVTSRVRYNGKVITVQDVLDTGGWLVNAPLLRVNGLDVASAYAYMNGVTLHKTATLDDESGMIDYSVVMRNNDHENKSAIMDSTETQNMTFEDTFDSRLEYVPDSLKLELRKYEDSWNSGATVATFTYKGKAKGNTLSVSADDFVTDSGQTLAEYAANASGKSDWYNLFFTYKLEIKEEAKSSVATELKLDNTATVKWDGPNADQVSASDSVSYRTGLLTKELLNAPADGEAISVGSRLQYQVELNPEAADLSPNSDILTVLDSLPDCLNVVWDTSQTVNIKGEYWDEAQQEWISFDDTNAKYSWSKTYYYDEEQQKDVLRFRVPDSLRVRITYECQITQTGNAVQVSNTVSVLGYVKVKDTATDVLTVEEKKGSAESDVHQFAVIKTDANTRDPMANVKFVLYGLEDRSETRTPPDGVDATITGSDGQKYYYLSTFTTDENGYCLINDVRQGNKYVLQEWQTSDSYILMDDLYIYYTDTPSNGSNSNYINVFKDETIAVSNDAPELTKEITSGTTKEQVNGETRETASIGDTVGFKLNVRVPGYPADATNKTFYIKDVLSDGLTLSQPENKGFCVVTGYNDEQETVLDESAYTTTVQGQAIYIDFKYDKIASYDSITVTYQAVLNDQAVAGDTGNPNVANLIYSTMPYSGSTYDPASSDARPEGQPGYGKLKDEVIIYIDNETEITNPRKLDDTNPIDGNPIDINPIDTQDTTEYSLPTSQKDAAVKKTTTKIPATGDTSEPETWIAILLFAAFTAIWGMLRKKREQ